MRTFYILDTSVLASDPNSFKNFSNSTVIVPINVLDELDKLKSFPGEVGRNARVFIRTLDALCKLGEIHKGIKLENNCTIKVDANTYSDQFGDSSTYVDNKILSCAFELNKKKTNKVVLVSNDINLRVRAKVIGLFSQDYADKGNQTEELFKGHIEIVDDALGAELYDKGFVELSSLKTHQISHNEFVNFISSTGKGISIGRRVGNKIRLVKPPQAWGLNLANKEQAMAVDLLLDPTIPLVTLIGKAGCGKTLCAIAAAAECVIEQKRYKQIMIYRPMEAVGKDLGYLPGSIDEKLDPWMSPISDSFEVLFSAGNKSEKNKKWKVMFDMYKDEGIIQLQAMTYIRGRSIPNAFIIIDESQNISKQEIKTILTRAGTGTKIVLTGDIEQIDHMNLDAINNGLSYVIDKFKDSDLAGHITLTKGERSPLATKAAEIL